MRWAPVAICDAPHHPPCQPASAAGHVYGFLILLLLTIRAAYPRRVPIKRVDSAAPGPRPASRKTGDNRTRAAAARCANGRQRGDRIIEATAAGRGFAMIDDMASLKQAMEQMDADDIAVAEAAKDRAAQIL